MRAARQARLGGGEEPRPANNSGPRKRARWFPRTPTAAAIVTALTVGVVVTVTPAEGAAGDIASSFARAVRNLVSTSQNGQDFAGTPAVGALFTMSKGKLGQHFCTASVVGSPEGDLVITAAHCVTGTSGFVFVPGYDRGAAPYGTWSVTKVYVDQSWKSSSDPDDDVAFLRVSQAGSIVPIEDVTGAEALQTGTPARQLVLYLQPPILALAGGIAGTAGSRVWAPVPVLDIRPPSPNKLSSARLAIEATRPPARPTAWVRFTPGFLQ